MRFLVLAALAFLSPIALATPTTIYSDRASFLDALRHSITDDYSGYNATPHSPLQLTDAKMTAVLGETRYESISFPDLNLVGNVYAYGDGTDYCAGCNGDFTLFFDDTSFSRHYSVFGVGLDIVLHTSRHSSLGTILPGDTSVPGTVHVVYSNGDSDDLTVPADVGFLGPQIYFLGLTDTRGIFSLTVGTEPLTDRHTWVIDNLTIGTNVPEPGTLPLAALGLVAVISLGKYNAGGCRWPRVPHLQDDRWRMRAVRPNAS